MSEILLLFNLEYVCDCLHGLVGVTGWIRIRKADFWQLILIFLIIKLSIDPDEGAGLDYQKKL